MKKRELHVMRVVKEMSTSFARVILGDNEGYMLDAEDYIKDRLLESVEHNDSLCVPKQVRTKIVAGAIEAVLKKVDKFMCEGGLENMEQLLVDHAYSTLDWVLIRRELESAFNKLLVTKYEQIVADKRSAVVPVVAPVCKYCGRGGSRHQP
jgi:hypothetical protein